MEASEGQAGGRPGQDLKGKVHTVYTNVHNGNSTLLHLTVAQSN